MKASLVVTGLVALVVPTGCCAVSPLPLQQTAEAPSVGAALEALGYAYYEEGRFDDAEAAFLSAIDSGDLDDAEAVWLTLATLRSETGDAEGAVEAFQHIHADTVRERVDQDRVVREAALRDEAR